MKKLKPANVMLSEHHKNKAKEISNIKKGNANKQISISHGIQVAIEEYKVLLTLVLAYSLILGHVFLKK